MSLSEQYNKICICNLRPLIYSGGRGGDGGDRHEWITGVSATQVHLTIMYRSTPEGEVPAKTHPFSQGQIHNEKFKTNISHSEK